LANRVRRAIRVGLRALGSESVLVAGAMPVPARRGSHPPCLDPPAAGRVPWNGCCSRHRR
jgi:hypothetical protein